MIGALTITAGLLALVYGVSEASTKGWADTLTVASLAAAFVLIAGFVQIERVREAPLVPLGIFRTPGLSQANIVVFLFQGAYVGWQFLATLYLQDVMHWSPVEVGLIFAPGGVMVVLTAQRWAGLVGKIGAWPIALAGIVLICLGFVWTLEIGNLNSVVVFGVAQLIMGTGYAMCYPATNITAVASAQPDQQGLASGLFIAAFQVGSGVLLGIVASVFAGAGAGLSAYRPAITVAIAAAALAALVCGVGVVRSRRPAEPRRLQEPA
jgi:predicted MFS family arabinose efflux permease